MDNFNVDDGLMFLHSGELDSYLEEALSTGNYDSSSPDGPHDHSSMPSKNILSEKNRRDKLNQRLYALRAVVPKISKMDRASIIRDAIEYINSLHEEERRIQAEILEMESGKLASSNMDNEDQCTAFSSSIQKRSRNVLDHYYDHHSSSTYIMPSSHPIELLELRVSSMCEKIIVVSLTCSKRTDTMVKLCEIFESLNLKIITANITAFSGSLLKTVFLEGDEEEREVLNFKIRAAIAAQNDLDSPNQLYY